ncbi:MAG: aldehyde dehydrogenase family protein [Jatrophihabitans sp.]
MNTPNVSTLLGVRRTGGEVQPVRPCPVDVTNPASGELYATVIGGGRDDAMLALDAADGAYDSWRQVPDVQRAAALRRIADRLQTEAGGDLPSIITAETGKRLAESRAELEFSAAYFRWFAAMADGARSQRWRVRPDLNHHVTAKPVGIVAVMTPWNFPVSIPARKVAPALAAGCSVVFKPSEVAPVSGLRFAELVEAELPTNVLTTVVGPAEHISAAWTADKRVRAISFTGSTRIGRILAGQAAGDFKRMILELGGKASFIVLADADVTTAVESLLVAKYRNNGQSCIAADSVFVAAELYDRFVEQFLSAASSLQLGDPMLATTTLGPMALPSDPARVAALASDAESAGAELARPTVGVPDTGYFAPPVICLRPPPQSRIAQEEIFGPLLTISAFVDVADVIRRTNIGRMGLAGYVVGSNIAAAQQIASQLDIGIAGINTGTPNTPQVPFGGTKDSGLGYEGGAAGLDAFLHYQTVAVPSELSA